MNNEPRSPKSVPYWKDSPRRVKAVAAFSKQPKLTREEQVAQSKRNKAELAKRATP